MIVLPLAFLIRAELLRCLNCAPAAMFRPRVLNEGTLNGQLNRRHSGWRLVADFSMRWVASQQSCHSGRLVAPRRKRRLTFRAESDGINPSGTASLLKFSRVLRCLPGGSLESSRLRFARSKIRVRPVRASRDRDEVSFQSISEQEASEIAPGRQR